FYVKATKIGTYCFTLMNGDSDRSYVSEYTVNVSNTWEKKTIRLKHDETGTWDLLNGIGMRVIWTISAGTDFQTTADSWNGGNFISTSNQVNGCDAINNEFKITQIQLHEGVDEIPFNELTRDFGSEVTLCQRYYEKSGNLSTVPNGGVIGLTKKVYSGASDTLIAVTQKFTTKRDTPIFTTFGVGVGVTSKVHRQISASGGTDITCTYTFVTEKSAQVSVVGSAGQIGSFIYSWVAEAEL
ncbi:unnamed protein product, partial [marine sediment metagenome]